MCFAAIKLVGFKMNTLFCKLRPVAVFSIGVAALPLVLLADPNDAQLAADADLAAQSSQKAEQELDALFRRIVPSRPDEPSDAAAAAIAAGIDPSAIVMQRLQAQAQALAISAEAERADKIAEVQADQATAIVTEKTVTATADTDTAEPAALATEAAATHETVAIEAAPAMPIPDKGVATYVPADTSTPVTDNVVVQDITLATSQSDIFGKEVEPAAPAEAETAFIEQDPAPSVEQAGSPAVAEQAAVESSDAETTTAVQDASAQHDAPAETQQVERAESEPEPALPPEPAQTDIATSADDAVPATDEAATASEQDVAEGPDQGETAPLINDEVVQEVVLSAQDTEPPTQAIELRSSDGLVSVLGTITKFDGSLITVETSYGIVGVEAEGLECIGAACPPELLASSQGQ